MIRFIARFIAQTFCTDALMFSDWTWSHNMTAVVQPLPDNLPRPTILEPLVHDHDFLTVQNLLRGAIVDIYSTVGNTRVGGGFSTGEWGSFKIDPPIDANDSYYAVQQLCDLESEPSIDINPDWDIPAPHIPGPLCVGDYYVEVCDIVPYSNVEIYVNGVLSAETTGNGCALRALGGTTVLSLGDTVTARQFIASGSEAWSEGVTVSIDGIPEYNPDYWNGASHVTRNGCYDYAVDKRNDLNAIPGVAGGAPTPSYKPDYTCQALIEAVLADGLVPVDAEGECHGCSHKVALYLSPWINPTDIEPYYVRVGHHFYREDPGGETWSHKFGTQMATNRDASNNLITHHSTADRDYSDLPHGYYEDYYELCGEFCVDKKTVNPLGGESLIWE